MELKPSPLAPAQLPELPPISGVRIATGNSGIRYKGRPDVLLMEFAPGTQVAGVFTRSQMPAAPVDWCRAALKGKSARVLVANAGNSNAFTGKAGVASVKRMAQAAAGLFRCKPGEVYIASTGVIGVKLPDEKITRLYPELKLQLYASKWDEAADAIRTTDTFKKVATRTAKIGGVKVTLSGIAKGSGMIAPDMATLFAFVFTDAAIPSVVLQKLFADANSKSFNAITVDSDTSTSDTALIFATGQAKHAKIKSATDKALADFKKQLDALMIDLAQQIVKDGEGATKFVSVTVKGAKTDAAARIIGLAIGNSPLVKTAIAGEDANWGRIVAAVGKSGEKANRDKLSLWIGKTCIAKSGQAVAGYDEAPVAAHMKGQYIDIVVDVGVGKGKATIWTCDLTHGYIDINGSYRT